MIRATRLQETIAVSLSARAGGTAAILENAMSQQHPPENRAGASGSGHAAVQLIEKGWTVYDAGGRPVGNVTEIDDARGVLELDGRPQGSGSFQIPLTMVASTSDGNVQLAKVVDPNTSQVGGPPRFVD